MIEAEAAKVSARLSYPCLKYWEHPDQEGISVVLFTGPKRGVLLVRRPFSEEDIGREQSGWAEEEFREFIGEVRLRNAK